MGTTLMPNQHLELGQSLVTHNGRFELTMQTDGNLVLYRRENRHPMWGTNTTGQDVAAAVMQADGNLVLYTFGHRPAWGSETEHQGPTWLRLLETGHLEIAGVRGVWGAGVPEIPGTIHLPLGGYSVTDPLTYLTAVLPEP